MDIGERVKTLRLSRGWSQGTLAAKVDIDRTSLVRYEAGTVAMTAQTLQKIADALEFPITTLYGIPAAQVDVGPWEAIPILGRIPAGELKFTEETVEGYINVPYGMVRGGMAFALRVQGDCMAPPHGRFKDGDLAFVRVQPEVENDELAVVVVDDEATMKRVTYASGFLILKADNPEYPPILVPLANARIVGRVVGGAFDL